MPPGAHTHVEPVHPVSPVFTISVLHDALLTIGVHPLLATFDHVHADAPFAVVVVHCCSDVVAALHVAACVLAHVPDQLQIGPVTVLPEAGPGLPVPVQFVWLVALVQLVAG